MDTIDSNQQFMRRFVEFINVREYGQPDMMGLMQQIGALPQ